MVTRFSISKQHLFLDKICQMKDICHQYYILNRNKRSHDPENHCGYMIILDLAKSPFVNTLLRQNLAETKVLTLRLDLSLRPG